MPKKVISRKNSVLQAVQNLSKTVNSRFTEVGNSFQSLSESMDNRFQELNKSLNSRFTEVHEAIMTLAAMTEGRFDRLEGRVVKLETGMVTKEYLDDKLADLRGDVVVMTRRPNMKVDTLVGVLHEKRIISDTDVRKVNSATH